MEREEMNSLESELENMRIGSLGESTLETPEPSTTDLSVDSGLIEPEVDRVVQPIEPEPVQQEENSEVSFSVLDTYGEDLTAKTYVASEQYLWNSGMFMFKASVYLDELKKFRPDILAACKESLSSASTDLDFIRLNSDVFAECPDESIDYAVMEKTQDCVVIPLDADWSDIGSWTSLWEISEKDEHENTVYRRDVHIKKYTTIKV